MAILITEVFLISVWASQLAFSEVIAITKENEKEILEKYDFVLIDFYADWCRFSAMLFPILEDLSNRLPTALPNVRIAIAKIDCEEQGQLAKINKIGKYPTLKLAKFKKMTNSEYRGQRSAEAMLEYLIKESQTRVTVHESEESIPFDTAERSIVGLFEKADLSFPPYSSFHQVSHLVAGCEFHAAPANVSNPVIYFYKKSDPKNKITCPIEAMSSSESLADWISPLCTPLVQELTFANAEEFTERGLPLFILFFHPSDTDILSSYKAILEQHFPGLSHEFTFIYASGVDFSHALMHLGKTTKDLPLLCIDSLQHMFPFPYNIKEDLKSGDPTRMRRFMDDSKSGKLHRQFHGQTEPSDRVSSNKVIRTTPSDSVFKKLSPSHNRYSLLHEEL